MPPIRQAREVSERCWLLNCKQPKRLLSSRLMECPHRWGYGHSIDDLESFEFAADLFFGLAKPLLQTAEQLIFLALGERQVVLR